MNSKYYFPIYLIVIFGMLFGFLWVTTPGNYINRPFSECYENFSVSYGAFESCGRLMSKETAMVGLGLIYIGLPVLAFVILPLLIKMKKIKIKKK